MGPDLESTSPVSESRSRLPDVLPLILVQSWPSSINCHFTVVTGPYYFVLLSAFEPASAPNWSIRNPISIDLLHLQLLRAEGWVFGFMRRMAILSTSAGSLIRREVACEVFCFQAQHHRSRVSTTMHDFGSSPNADDFRLAKQSLFLMKNCRLL